MRASIWGFLKRVLFLFDAEFVHRLTVRFLRIAIFFGSIPLRLLGWGARRSIEVSQNGREAPRPRVFDMEFESRLGLAAGFDKDAEILSGLPELGFGFAEIGTVTPRPQPGNPTPRLFRDSERSAIFNRMGFNGMGASIVSERLEGIRPTLPRYFRVGVNIGKNKDTPNEEAASDYVRAAKPFEGLADYLVINVSSPNTPGLRSLQTVEALKPIIGDTNELISGWKRRPPLLLKLAPEVQGEDLRVLIEAAEQWGVNGWVLTNTLAGSIEVEQSGKPQSLPGGWSGGPLTEKSRQSLIEARALTRLPIISVGGITTPEEAILRIRLGADLIQVYSGWVFGGPAFPGRVARAIENIRI